MICLLKDGDMVYNTTSNIESHMLLIIFPKYFLFLICIQLIIFLTISFLFWSLKLTLSCSLFFLLRRRSIMQFFILAIYYFFYKISTMFCYLEFSCALLAFCFGNVRWRRPNKKDWNRIKLSFFIVYGLNWRKSDNLRIKLMVYYFSFEQIQMVVVDTGPTLF